MAQQTTFVSLEDARAATGMRLVVVAHIPSPWSESAKGIFRVKGLPFLAVRLEPGDRTVREWTRTKNAPVALFDDEPPRSGWAEILDLAERVAPKPSLLPSAPADRVLMFGLAHEIMGQGGLLWSGRLLTIDAGVKTEGARGFPGFVAGYLGKRYGYAKVDLTRTRKRIDEAWSLLGDALGAKPYYFDDRVTALDLYSATAVNIFAPPSETNCPMSPPIRAAFESMKDEIGAVPAAILAHRDRMYERHLELPIVL